MKIANALRKIEQQLTRALSEEEIERDEIVLVRNRIGAQAEALEKGLHDD